MKTAVEWLVDYLKNIKELPFIRQNLNINEQNILNDIIEQAKEMEAEQRKNDYRAGWNDNKGKDLNCEFYLAKHLNWKNYKTIDNK
jgi:hypothetical protein